MGNVYMTKKNGENDEKKIENEQYECLRKKLLGLSHQLVLSQLDDKLFARNKQEISEKWEKALDISEVLRGLKSEVNYASDKNKAMSKMLVYLGLVESIGATIINILLLTLALNRKEVHTRGPYTRHVKTYSEIEDLDLGYKMDFLNNEGFEMISKYIKRDVRNIIGHLKFTIENNGTIRDPDNNPILIDRHIKEFWEGIDTIKRVFDDIAFFENFGIKQ